MNDVNVMPLTAFMKELEKEEEKEKEGFYFSWLDTSYPILQNTYIQKEILFGLK